MKMVLGNICGSLASGAAARSWTPAWWWVSLKGVAGHVSFNKFEVGHCLFLNMYLGLFYQPMEGKAPKLPLQEPCT